MDQSALATVSMKKLLKKAKLIVPNQTVVCSVSILFANAFPVLWLKDTVCNNARLPCIFILFLYSVIKTRVTMRYTADVCVRKSFCLSISPSYFMGGSRGGGGGGQEVRTPLKNHKNIGVFAILVWVPWRITKLPSQHSMFGPHLPASESWRTDNGPITCSYNLSSWTLRTSIHEKNIRSKTQPIL